MISPHKQEIFLTCLFCFLSVCVGVGPKLDRGEEEVFYTPANSSEPREPLIINCEGDTKLTWRTKVPPEYYKENSSETDGTHYSSLLIEDPLVEDTGYFYCLNERNETASTYIYINDGVHGFVNTEGIKSVSFKIGSALVLDCRTTHPDIKVTVWKDTQTQDVTSLFEKDRFNRFSKIAESLQETGLYYCKEDRYSSIKKWLVNIGPHKSLQPPSITTFRNAHYVVGYNFSIDCRIPVDIGDDPMFKWDIPNKEKKHETRTNNLETNFAMNTLSVLNPSAKDSGRYTCIVSQGQESVSVAEDIYIEEMIEPYVRFNSTSSRPALFVKEGETSKWVLYFRGFPDKLKYRFYDPSFRIIRDGKDKKQIIYDYNEGMILLLINDSRAEDFGNYTVELEAPNGLIDSKWVFLVVNATPKVEFISVPRSVPVNAQATVNVAILAFELSQPHPTITWKFYSSCPEGVGSCDKSVGVQLNHSRVLQNPRNNFTSSVTFTPSSSGLIEVKVENKFGENSTETHLFVSDKIGALFLISVKSEAGNRTLTRGNVTAITVIEDDDITIECFALDFLYKNLQFIQNGTLIEGSKCDTNLSSGVCHRIEFVNSKAASSYECRATNLNSNKEELIRFQLSVEAKMAPIIKAGSNVSEEGTEVSVNASEAFKLFCLVDGRPTPKITWFKDEVNIEQIPNFVDKKKVFFHKRKQIIEFKFAQKEYEGQYMCQAENRIRTIRAYTSVSVEGMGPTVLQWVVIFMAIGCILVLVVVVVFLTIRVKRESKLRNELRMNRLYLFEKGNIGDLNKECTIDEQADLLPYDRAFEVEKDRIKLGKQLGAGAFGRVVQAEVDDLEKEGQSTRVAVKMCKDGADTAHLRALTLELKIMVHLGKHLNIVNLMGAYTGNMKKGDLWILVEYCKYGNVLKFIQRCKSRFVNQIDPATGAIDSTRTTPLPSDTVSPGSYGRNSRGFSFSRGTSEDADGYLETRSQAGSMRSSRPLARNISNISQTGSVSATVRPGLYVGNPHYATVGVMQQTFQGTSGPSPLPSAGQVADTTTESTNSSEQHHYVVAGQLPPLQIPSRHMSTTSNPGSEVVYHPNAQTEVISLSSHAPFSPTYSTSGETFFDSQGNPVTFDSGGVPGVASPLTTTDLVCWAWQVANGMEYLTKRKVLHGDLAARNLLLAENNVVKISDFGLSRDIYKNDIYMKKGDEIMPIKWMAPEAIQQKVFSIQSDVWAYGITLWEMFTLGNTPYPGVPLNQEFTIALENGMRMEKPKYCNDELYDLMMECWKLNPTERPSFCRVSEYLSQMLSQEHTENYVAMNTVYAKKNEEWLEFKEDYLNMVTSPDFQNIQAQIDTSARDNLNIAMQELQGQDASENGASGYLDMRSVRGSESIFSPRPPSETAPASKTEPSVFTFPGRELALSEDLQSPLETSTLLQSSESRDIQKTDEQSTSQPLFTNNNNINKMNMINQQQTQPLYQNLDKVTTTKKQTIDLNPMPESISIDVSDEESTRNYVNIAKSDDGYMNTSEMLKL